MLGLIKKILTLTGLIEKKSLLIAKNILNYLKLIHFIKYFYEEHP